MKFRITSRQGIEALAQEPFALKTAVISIADANDNFAELGNKPEHLLQLHFNDIDADVFKDELGRKPTDAEIKEIEQKYHMLSDAQAKEIATFYHQISRDNVDLLICQCEHGQSRSAGVMAAILEHRCRQGIQVFANDNYYPNKTIFKKVLKQLKGGIQK